MTITCVRCLGPVRRRWWQRGLLRPMPVHTWTDAALCESRINHPARPAR